MIDLNKPPEDQELPKRCTHELFGTTYESMWIEEMDDFNKRKDVIPIEREVRRLVANSRASTRERWHGRLPGPNIFDRHLGRICGIPVEMITTILTVMFESMCFMNPSLVEDIVHVLNEHEYEHVNRCRTCQHFKEDGCYLKWYKQTKSPQDFCSSHSSYAHGSNNQQAF